MPTILAQQNQNGGILIAAVVIAILMVVPFLVIRALRSMHRDRVKDASAAQTPGMVRFVFHQYSGFLVWTRQSTYDTVLPINDAEILLRKLVRHNLTRGLFVYGGIFVPIFTFFEWRSQKKRIAAARPGFPVSVVQK